MAIPDRIEELDITLQTDLGKSKRDNVKYVIEIVLIPGRKIDEEVVKEHHQRDTQVDPEDRIVEGNVVDDSRDRTHIYRYR